MTSVRRVRALIQSAVSEHRLVFNYWGEPIGCDCSLDCAMTAAEHAKHFTDVLMSLPDITIRSGGGGVSG